MLTQALPPHTTNYSMFAIISRGTLQLKWLQKAATIFQPTTSTIHKAEYCSEADIFLKGREWYMPIVWLGIDFGINQVTALTLKYFGPLLLIFTFHGAAVHFSIVAFIQIRHLLCCKPYCYLWRQRGKWIEDVPKWKVKNAGFTLLSVA